MAIQAGKLRHSITIQKRGTGRDAAGGELPTTWETFATVRASVEPLQGREYMAASGEQAVATTRFRIRYIPGVTASMRVLFEGRVFEMVSPPIDPNMLHRELLLMTEETEATEETGEEE